ncbi:MAG: hypothetical protein LBQ56_00495, partial [Synergistaceae bacterium]|nr:hypothetical protein [Synergistaceae bacterium]
MNEFQQELNCYHPSGTAPFTGLIATTLAGIAAGAVIAAVYAFAVHHDPLIYLNVLMAYGFGHSLAWVVSSGVRHFHIRSVPAALSMGVVIFAVSYAVHWFVYISTVLVDWETDSPFDIVTIAMLTADFVRDPERAWGVIRALNERGVWSISGSSSQLEMSGIMLAAVWVAEAVTICWLTVGKPMQEARKPYSERLGRWMTPRAMPAGIAFIDDVRGFKTAAAHNDYAALTTPLPAEAEGEAGNLKYATVVLYDDPVDPYVSVDNVSIKVK